MGEGLAAIRPPRTCGRAKEFRLVAEHVVLRSAHAVHAVVEPLIISHLIYVISYAR